MKKFETFDFSIKKIKKYLESLVDISQKLEYSEFIRKELRRMVRCFENEIYTPWPNRAQDCTERDIFIESRYNLYEKVYRRDKHNIDEYVNRDIANRKNELIQGLITIEDEIEYLNKTGLLKKDNSMHKYQKYWDELIAEYFKNDVVIRHREFFEKQWDEDEYINFITKKFKMKTVAEWMKFFDLENRTKLIENAKNADIPEINRYNAIKRINNTVFTETEIGRWTRGNLESFKEKYGGETAIYKIKPVENKFSEKSEKIIIKNIDKIEKQLKSFGRGELQEALEPIAKEFNLIIRESAPQKKVRLITKKLIEQGWDANEPSVGEGLRKMGYVKGKRK